MRKDVIFVIHQTNRDMELLIGGKATGKTTKLVKESAATGFVIVSINVANVKAMANDLDLIIPKPISFDKFFRKTYIGRDIRGFLIDDADMLLQELTGIPIKKISITVK